MLTREENDLLTQTDAGTPMGDFARRYWLPAFKSERLPRPGGAPIALKLFGERLVAFRDHEGAVSILDEFCPHRQASLAIARNEDCALTCVYHGWRIAGDGRVLETPPEPVNSAFAQSVRQIAYPTHEACGVVWVYMGPVSKRPPLPDLPFLRLPDAQVLPIQVRQTCNYLQGMEGDVEAAHAKYLHYSADEWERQSAMPYSFLTDPRPKHAVQSAPWGLQTMMRYETRDPGTTMFWVHPIVMPLFTFFGHDGPNGPMGSAHCWVPIDDVNHYVWTWMWDYTTPLSSELIDAVDASQRFTNADPDNDYLPRDLVDGCYVQHRDLMEAGLSFSGYLGVLIQDLAVQHSMGPIVDRTREHLASEDIVVVQFRRYLLRTLADFQRGVEPLPGLQDGMSFEQIDSRTVIMSSETTSDEVFANRGWSGVVAR